MTIPTAAGQFWTAKWYGGLRCVETFEHRGKLYGLTYCDGVTVSKPVDDDCWTWGEQIRVQDDGRVERHQLPDIPAVHTYLASSASTEQKRQWLNDVLAGDDDELSAATETQGTGEDCERISTLVARIAELEKERGEAVHWLSYSLGKDVGDKLASGEMSIVEGINELAKQRNEKERDNLELWQQVRNPAAERDDLRQKLIVEAAKVAELIGERDAARKELEDLKSNGCDASDRRCDTFKTIMQLNDNIVTARDDHEKTIADLRQQLAAPRGRLAKNNANRELIVTAWEGGSKVNPELVCIWGGYADRVIDALSALPGEDETEQLRAEVERLRKLCDTLDTSLDESRRVANERADEISKVEGFNVILNDLAKTRREEIDRLTAELARLREGRGSWPEGAPKIGKMPIEEVLFVDNQMVRWVIDWNDDTREPYTFHNALGKQVGPHSKTCPPAIEWLTPQPAPATAEATVDLENYAKRLGTMYADCWINAKGIAEIIADIARSVVRETASGEGGE